MIALGMDIGGTNIKAGVVDDSGEIIRQHSLATPISPAEFRKSVQWLMHELGVESANLAGVGIGCKGIIDWETTRISRMPGLLMPLEGELLRDLIPYELPIFADNDAKVSMVGEMVWGAARGRNDVVMFTLGTGVGGAIVANGKMVRGMTGVAGHLGHTTTVTDGPLCICGNRGCIETLFSAGALEVEAYRLAHNGCLSSLTDEFRDYPERITCKDVFDHAERGDSACQHVRDVAVNHLAAAIAGLLHVLDPEVVIVGGQIVAAGPALLKPLEAEVHRRSEWLLQRKVPIVVQQVNDRTGVTGGAALVFNEIKRK
jgi:glucokinase